MKLSITAILILLGLASCHDDQTSKIKREGEPAVYVVATDDAEMNGAIKEANETLDKFNKALSSANPAFRAFALKTSFKTSNGGEHIWVSKVVLKGGEYFGVVDNLPESTTEVKIGATVQIAKDKISDWMYIDNRKLRGGFTIRLLRQRMTESERNQFDLENGVIVED